MSGNKIMIVGNKIKTYKDYKKANQILYKSPLDSFIMNKTIQWSEAKFEQQLQEYAKRGYSLFEIYYKELPPIFSPQKDEKIKNLLTNYCQQYFQNKQDPNKFLQDLKSIIK